MIPILKDYSQIKYLVISNVETKENIKHYLGKILSQIIILPKTENINAAKNFSKIISALSNAKKIVMLDHDDLSLTLIKSNNPKNDSKKYMTVLVEFCASNNVMLLRAIGVILGDGEHNHRLR